jgi:hypothetical protein
MVTETSPASWSNIFKEAPGVAEKESYQPCATAEWLKKKDETRNVTDLENLLPFYLSLNVAKYHNLNPHCGRL